MEILPHAKLFFNNKLKGGGAFLRYPKGIAVSCTILMKTLRIHYLIYILLAVLCYLSVIPAIFAETGYVSDMLILSLKEGPGREYNTLKTLRSNTPVEIIETTDRFLKVKTEEGDVGWVENQYITHELPKAIIIEQLTDKIALLEGRRPGSQTEQGESSESQAGNKSDNTIVDSKTSMEYINRIKSLEVALNAQVEKNRALQAQLSRTKPDQNQEALSESTIIEEDLQKDSDKGEEMSSSDLAGNDNMVLPDDDMLKTAMIKWFCAGAGVLIAGWFIGRNFTGGRRRGLLE